MTTFAPAVVAWSGTTVDDRPLVVLLHGRGSDETDIISLADHLPSGPAYAAVRAPIVEGGGYAWFANRVDEALHGGEPGGRSGVPGGEFGPATRSAAGG